MSQNSLVVPTTGTLSGLAAMQAVNAALDTLNTLAAGASAPSSPEAGQFWHDTGNNLLKIRSTDNTAWIVIGTLNETAHVFSAAVTAQPNLYGLIIANDASSPNSVLDIAAGGANDSTGSVYMRLATTTKKTVTTAWASGSGNGSLDTGTWTASKFYHVHLIYDAASGAVDVLTSLSYSNPVLPSGYTSFVPIGAIYSNASSNIAPFVQNGNEFLYLTDVQDQNLSAGLSPTLVALTVPPGLKVNALFRCFIESASATGAGSILFQSPDQTAASPSSGNSSLACDVSSGSPDTYAAGEFSVRTNTSSQIRIATSPTTGSVAFSIATKGFVYPRGLT